MAEEDWRSRVTLLKLLREENASVIENCLLSSHRRTSLMRSVENLEKIRMIKDERGGVRGCQAICGAVTRRGGNEEK